MTPLSIEKLSLGKPAMFQACILIGSPRVLLRENSAEHGKPFSYKTPHTQIMREISENRYTSLSRMLVVAYLANTK